VKNHISENRFGKVVLTAQRAKQLHKGARPHILRPGVKATRIALEEIELGLVGFELMPDLKTPA
jgi:DNA-directed RNA polymerase omega subunit